MFASDGMRPDLMEKYAKAGEMPTYRKLMKDRVTGDNGMLQAFPPNTGVGWYTMATGAYPAEHGSTNNTFFRAGDTFSNRTSFSAPGTLQADTIAKAAERAGKKVAQIDWVGGAAANIQGPTVDFTNFFSNRGVLVGVADPVEAAGSAFFGVTYQDATLAPAAGWSGVPAGDPAAPPKETTWAIPSTFAAQNPNRTYNVYFYDSVTGGGGELRPRDRQPGRQDRRSAVDRPEGRRLPADQADRRQRPDRPASRPDGRPLREADLARARRQPVQALRHLALARDREMRHGRATACPPAAPARTGSRSTSPTTCCRGRPATSRRWKPASSTRTRTSSRAAISSGPTASR